MSRVLPCLLYRFQLSFFYLIAFSSFFTGDAEYVTQPVSVNTSLNSTVTFTCEATDAILIFFNVGEIPASQVTNVNRGFMELGQETINGTIRRQLSVYAREINNNSIIHCVAYPSDIRSDNATLRIQGLLASVVDLDYTFINGSSVLLTWTAPYTLDNVPITGYYIVDRSVNITTTNKSIILSATNPDPCILNDVSVSAINNVGIGSSDNISFYYETVPLITPPVSVVPVIDGQLISLNISIDVSTLCKGEYPNSITVNILNTDDTVINNTSIPTQVNDQLMITGVITVPNNLNTFIVNVSLSNNGGEFPIRPSFGFGKVGPVINIDSLIDNCSSIDITWTAPTVDDRVSILFYKLSIYDTITGSLVNTVSVYDTSYQFVDMDLFIHRYTYVITGVNELGEGISNNDTFSYQRVPRSVTGAGLRIITFNETSATVSFNILVTLECVGEAPENATVMIQCNGTVVYDNTTLVADARAPINITGSVPVPLNQQCTITIVFSNEAGSSDPFIQPFDTISDMPSMSSTPSPTNGTEETTTSSPDPITRPEIIGAIVGGIVVLLLIMIVLVVICYKEKKKKKGLLFPTESVAFAGSEPATDRKIQETELTDIDESLQRTQTTVVPDDDYTVPVSYDTPPVEASSATTGGSEMITTQKQSKPSARTKETTGAIRGAAAKEPIYSDLGVAPPTTKLAKPKAPSVLYADIGKIVPRSKATAQPQSYDDVVVSASGTIVIEAIGGDTNPPAIPDKKSKGATTTGHRGTNGETDAARNLPHHINDDSHFPPSRPPPLPPHASVEGMREGGREERISTVPATYL